MQKIIFAVLSILTLVAALAALGGIWGALPGDTAWQLIGTFFVLALATIALERAADHYLK
jgi:membrane protein implicated in regulation of membrane protease activity